MTTFAELDLIDPLLQAISDAGYTEPTPIQQQAIGPVLEGYDLLGCAQTGTGKTAAFALPILDVLHSEENAASGKRPTRALILAPTRELAGQIQDSFTAYGSHLRLRSGLVIGGVNQRPQVAALKRGIDILVATPGRLLDLLDQGHVALGQLEFFVLDEADRMLDMGFIHDMRRIIAMLPQDCQRLMFSATIPPTIAELAADMLLDPVRIDIEPESPAVERIEQRLYYVERNNKRTLLVHLLDQLNVDQAIVFTRTKRGANRLAKHLNGVSVEAAAIHGNKSQNARQRALTGFRSGEVKILVATDIAARGLDIEAVSHVFNYDLPNEAETYVHRIGRTARAGREGVALALCDASEADYLRDIERLLKSEIPVVEDHPYAVAPPERPTPSTRQGRSGGGGGGGGGRQGRRGGRGRSRGGRGRGRSKRNRQGSRS